MKATIVLWALLAAGGAGPSGHAIGASNGAAPPATSFVPTNTMLDNMDMQMRSLRLTGPNNGRSGSGWLMLRAGSRVCFDVDTPLLPRCNVRLYYDLSLYLRTDSPFSSLYMLTNWVQLTPRSPDTCDAAKVGTIISHAPAGARTRACLCTSDGGGPATYAWQNLVSGTVGTSTTCDL